MAAWGEVTERTFQRMVVKPDWGIRTFTCEDGKDHLVDDHDRSWNAPLVIWSISV